MGIYRYKATDKQGGLVEGSISATSASDAQKNLIARGLSVQSIDGKAVSAAPNFIQNPQPSPPPSSNPNLQPTPSIRAQPNQNLQAVAAPNIPSAINIVQPHRGTKASVSTNAAKPSANPSNAFTQAQPHIQINSAAAGANQNTKAKAVPIPKSEIPGCENLKTLYLLFAQFASYYQSGQNPVTMLDMLSKTQHNKYYALSLEKASQEVAQGTPLSQALAKYHNLYPPHVQGTLAAAEAGAFMAQGCTLLAEQFQQASKMNTYWKWFCWISAINIFCLWPIWVLMKSMPSYWKALDAAGGRVNGFSAYGHAIWMDMKGGSLPFLAIAFIGCWLINLYWRSEQNRMLRHTLILKASFLGKRARSESLTHFMYVMSLVSKAGISPFTVYKLASNSVPNQRYRKYLVESGEQMTENTKLSDILIGTQLIPPEYSMMVQTGEVTGTLSQALEQVSSAEGNEFQLQNKKGLAQLGCWGFLIIFICFAFAFWIYIGYLHSAISFWTQP